MTALTGVAKHKARTRGKVEAAKGRPTGRLALAAAIAAAVATSLFAPLVGIPMMLAVFSYVGIKLLAPHKVIRGRVLSELQQHRVAIISGAAILGVAAACSTVVYGLGVASRLEHRLRADIDRAHDSGSLVAGARFRECEEVVCATATVIQLPTSRTLGVAKLRGMTLDSDTMFGWRKAHPARFVADD